jgi:rare lipoprotein A
MKEIICYIILASFFKFSDSKANVFVFNNLQDSLGIKLNTRADSLDSVTNKDSTKPKYYYGTASFYSRSLEGTKTSNDEIFRHNKLTAASNKFKLGTWLRVTNISNGKSVIVRINDRMHPKMAKKGRIVDLSRTGAKKLDFINKGITRVKVEIVPKETKE